MLTPTIMRSFFLIFTETSSSGRAFSLPWHCYQKNIVSDIFHKIADSRKGRQKGESQKPDEELWPGQWDIPCHTVYTSKTSCLVFPKINPLSTAIVNKYSLSR